jgi:hypothetical protein
VIQDSTLDELTAEKFRLSVGVQSRGKNFPWSFAITENVTNFEKTPDIVAQMGLAYMPRAR